MYLEKNIYLTFSILCLFGYLWLGYNLNIQKKKAVDTQICFIKKTTGLPCPSCGSTRSVLSIINGDFSKALLINPLGFFVSVIMIALPIWITIDICRKRKTLYIAYKKTENIIKKKSISSLLIAFILINWIWNIIKEL